MVSDHQRHMRRVTFRKTLKYLREYIAGDGFSYFFPVFRAEPFAWYVDVISRTDLNPAHASGVSQGVGDKPQYVDERVSGEMFLKHFVHEHLDGLTAKRNDGVPTKFGTDVAVNTVRILGLRVGVAVDLDVILEPAVEDVRV